MLLSDRLCGVYVVEQMNKTNARIRGGCFDEITVLYN